MQTQRKELRSSILTTYEEANKLYEEVFGLHLLDVNDEHNEEEMKAIQEHELNQFVENVGKVIKRYQLIQHYRTDLINICYLYSLP